MRIFLLTAATMIAFAANSILTRLAIDAGLMDPLGFALARVAAGALVLVLLVRLRGAALPLFQRARLAGAFSLALYMIGFSLAYLTLDAGLGALILFGVVQITMFGHAALTGAAPSGRQLSGAGLAFAGLVLMLWPSGETGTDLLGAGAMALAGLGWAAYSIIGRGAGDPVAASAGNFLLCLPLMLILPLVAGVEVSAPGLALAALCGGVTSGLGYALWYSVLRQIDAVTAAVAQLSVPVIAILGGVMFLGEAVSLSLTLATLLVLGGIAWALSPRSAPAGRR